MNAQAHTGTQGSSQFTKGGKTYDKNYLDIYYGGKMVGQGIPKRLVGVERAKWGKGTTAKYHEVIERKY